MESKLREYVEGLFENAPHTRRAVELKEEMIQNVIDKYNDLLENGKSKEAAYNIAVASIGDVGVLIEELKRSDAGIPKYTDEEIRKSRVKSAVLMSIAISLYILCIIPVLFFQDVIGVAIMFGMAAIATGLIIFNNMTKLRYNRSDDTVVEEFREWKHGDAERRKTKNAVSGIIWSVTVAIYFILSFLTGAWAYTWIVFIVGVAVDNIVEAIIELKK